MQKASLKSKSISAFFWDLTGNIANQGVSFVISIILARMLAPAEFGLIAMINVLFIFSNALLDVGLGAALIQRKRLLPIHFTSVFYFNITIGLILTSITYYSANHIASFYNQPLLINLTKVMSITFIINSITIVQNVKLKKSLDFKKIALLRFISNAIAGTTGIVMAYNGYGVWSLLVQLLLNKSIYTVLLWSLVKWVPQLAFSLKALKQLWGFGFRIFITNFLSTIFTQLDILIIGKLFPIATLGFYQRAKSLDRMVIQFSSNSMMQVLFPVFSSIQNDLDRLRSIVSRAMILLSFVIFFVIGIFYLCAENIILFLLTEKWLQSVEYFKILLLGGFIYPFSSLFVNIIVGRGNSKNNLKLALLKKIPQGINLAVGFFFGITGFLYGLLISSAISFFMNIHFTKKELNVNTTWFLKPLYPPLLLSFFLVISTNYLFDLLPEMSNFIALLVKGISFAIGFVLISYLLKFKALKLLTEEIKLISKRK